jgi:hypothetical protein
MSCSRKGLGGESRLCVHSEEYNEKSALPSMARLPAWPSEVARVLAGSHRAEPGREYAVKHGLETRLMDYLFPSYRSDGATRGHEEERRTGSDR